MKTKLLWIILVCLGQGLVLSARAGRLFYLSFDKMERTPVSVKFLPEVAKEGTEIKLADSAKLVKGVKGLGVYLENRSEFLEFSGAGNIRPKQGALAFWFRPMWAPNDGRDKFVFGVNFEQGLIMLYGNELCPIIVDAAGQRHYPPHAPCMAGTGGWKFGDWHHVVFNWGTTNHWAYLVIDGYPRQVFGYPAPAGKAGSVAFSPSPSDQSGRFPGCGVIDEVSIYDAPLGTNEIAALYQDGRKALGDFKPNSILEISQYPNLAKDATLTMDPKPNYGPPVYPSYCNDPNDALQLSDGDWQESFYNDFRSVGWCSAMNVTLDYDLGSLKRLGALAFHTGSGSAGAHFFNHVSFFAGPTRDRLVKIGEIGRVEPVTNTEWPKWHGRWAGIDHLDQLARFVRFVFIGGLFLDEVVIAGKGVEPVFVPVNLAAKPAIKPAVPAAVSNAPAVVLPTTPASERKWTLTAQRVSVAVSNAPCQTRFVFTLAGQGAPSNRAPAVVSLGYTAAWLIRGKTDYAQNPAALIDYETRIVVSNSQTLTLPPDDKGGLHKTVTVDVTNQPYGVFYLNAALRDEVGRVLATVNHQRYDVSVDLLALQSSKSAGLPPRAPKDIVGPDYYNFWYITGPPPPDTAANLIQGGCGWLQIRVDWRDYRSPSNIVCRVENLDRYVDAANDAGFSMIFSFADEPPEFIRNTNTEAFLAGYKGWTEFWMRRYKDKKMIRVWDVWNEPNWKSWVQHDNRDVQAIKIVHDLKEKYCPSTQVIISPNSKIGLNYLKGLLERGAAPYLDGAGVHPYRLAAPEVPEPDGYAGNPKGSCTFIDELANTRQLLLDYGIKPANVYITEGTYLINSIHEYDDNDHLNLMIRCLVLAKTLPYVPAYMIHSVSLGRLLSAALPNRTLHLMDTVFVERLAAGDDEIHAYLFRKSDGRNILPVWSITFPRTIRVSGLTGAPTIVDIYGNPLPCLYNAKAGAAEFVEIGRAPIYITAPPGGKPVIERQSRVEVKTPAELERGRTFTARIGVKALLTQRGTVTIQTDPDWTVTPARFEVTPNGSYKARILTARTSVPGHYPIIVELRDDKGTVVAVEDCELKLKRAAGEQPVAPGPVLTDDFESGALVGWRVQTSDQAEVGVITVDGRRVLSITQKFVDLAGALSRATEPVKWGTLTFAIKPSSQCQSFQVQYGAVRLVFDGKGGLALIGEKGASQSIGAYRPGVWQTVRVTFAAPEGCCRVWIGDLSLGRFDMPALAEGCALLRFMSGTAPTPKPAVFLLDNIKIEELKKEDAQHAAL